MFGEYGQPHGRDMKKYQELLLKLSDEDLLNSYRRHQESAEGAIRMGKKVAKGYGDKAATPDSYEVLDFSEIEFIKAEMDRRHLQAPTLEEKEKK